MLGRLGDVHSDFTGVLGEDNLFFWGSEIDIKEIDEITIGACQGQGLFLTLMLLGSLENAC
jgi:hypothetical protein